MIDHEAANLTTALELRKILTRGGLFDSDRDWKKYVACVTDAILEAALGDSVLYEHDGESRGDALDSEGLQNAIEWGMVQVYPEPEPEVKPTVRWCFSHGKMGYWNKDYCTTGKSQGTESQCDVADGDMVRRETP